MKKKGSYHAFTRQDDSSTKYMCNEMEQLDISDDEIDGIPAGM